MKVTAIANESLKDGFNVDFKIGDEIYGEATKYSQDYIWVEYTMKNDDELLLVQTKVKVVEGTITKEKPIPYNEMGGMNRKRTNREDVKLAAKKN